ncbi:methionine/alanine import family NSS transporter small subunit [Streptomyces poriticola]
MSGGAIVMMLIAILVVWGGLALAILQLRRHPDPGPTPEDEETPPAP